MNSAMERNGSLAGVTPGSWCFLESKPDRLLAMQNGVPVAMQIEQLRFTWAHWTAITEALLTLFLMAATLHLCASPLPTVGGLAENVPVGVWMLAFGVTALLKILGLARNDINITSHGRFLALLVWTALSVCVMLPGVPVMSWILGPMMASANFSLYIRRAS